VEILKMSRLTKFFLGFLIILLVLPLLVIGGMYFLGEIFQKITGLTPLKEELKKLTHTFITADQKLKVEYPLDWIKVQPEKLGEIIPKKYRQQYQIQLPLLAFKLTQEGKFAQLLIMELEIEKGKGFQEVVDILKKINQAKGWETTITSKIQKESRMVFFTSKYKKGEDECYGKEKMIFFPLEDTQKVYIISVLAWRENWEEIEKEAETILNSVRILD